MESCTVESTSNLDCEMCTSEKLCMFIIVTCTVVCLLSVSFMSTL